MPQTRRFSWLMLCSIAALTVFSEAGHAQNTSESVQERADFRGVFDVRSLSREPEEETLLPVRERTFPDLAPKGLTVGKLIVLPSLSVGGFYNDNIFAVDENEGTGKTSDFATVITPRINIQTTQDKNFFGLQASGEIIRYLQEENESIENFDIEASGNFELQHDLTLPWRVSHTLFHQGRVDNVSRIFTRDPLEINRTEFQAGVNYKPNRIGVGVSARRVMQRFEDGVSLIDPNFTVVRSDADFDTNEVQLELTYEFPVNHTAFIRGTYGDTTFQDSIFDDNTETFTGLFRDNKNLRILGGLLTNYKGILISDIGVGITSLDYDSDEIEDVSNLAIDADIDYNITRLTTLGLDLDRSIIEDNEVVQGFVQTRGTVSVDHELSRNLIASAFATYLNRDFDENNREDDLYRLGLGFLYRPSPHFNISGDYSYTTQDSTLENNDFDQNVFMMRLTGQY